LSIKEYSLSVGLFRDKWDEETSIVATFQFIAVAIDVSEYSGANRTLGVDVGDLWALYFWLLAPLESGEKRINENYLKLLKHKPGNPMQPNLTQSHQFPSAATFPSGDDFRSHIDAIAELVPTLKNSDTNLKQVNDATFLQECGGLIEGCLKNSLKDRVSNTTTAIVCVATLALRSVLKESGSLKTADRVRMREAAIFWVSMMIVTWHFKK